MIVSLKSWFKREWRLNILLERERLRFCERLSFFQSRWTMKNQKSISTEKDCKRIQIIHFENNNNNKKNVPCKVKPWFRDTGHHQHQEDSSVSPARAFNAACVFTKLSVTFDLSYSKLMSSQDEICSPLYFWPKIQKTRSRRLRGLSC